MLSKPDQKILAKTETGVSSTSTPKNTVLRTYTRFFIPFLHLNITLRARFVEK